MVEKEKLNLSPIGKKLASTYRAPAAILDFGSVEVRTRSMFIDSSDLD